MRPAVAVKRMGYGWKKGKNSRLVYAVVNHETQAILEGKQGPITYPYDQAGLAKARQIVADLKAAQ